MKKNLPASWIYSKAFMLTFSTFILFCSILPAQTIYYVATTGVDTNPGTLISPFKTISKGITASAATGDTIKVAPGTYTVVTTTTVNKSVAIIGTGASSADVVLDRGTYAVSVINGFTVTSPNVIIKNMKVTRFDAGISNTAAASSLILDNVQLVENYSAGFYSTAAIDNLAIINSILSYNGNKPGFTSVSTSKRGIYLLNGATYAGIRFENNTVDYNGLAGIEISSISTTTSIDSIVITHNLVRNNGDAQVSAWLGTSNPLKRAVLISTNTIVLSDSSRYGIEIRNPAGNGKASGNGSVVISDNNISIVNHTGSSRDMAAIAVIRRKEGATLASFPNINDQPQGVVVTGNTISDFQNPKAGDAYGIVFGGIGHKVSGNIISNTEFPIQLQSGNINFALFTSAPDVAGQIPTPYFDRDNSKYVCAEAVNNTITGSGEIRFTTGNLVTSSIFPVKTTNNTTIAESFCSIQQAIDFKATVTGNTITANAGTFDEQVIINKAIILDGVDSSNRIALFTGTVTGVKGIFTVASTDVTIKNFKFIVNLSKIYTAIVSTGNTSNLLITRNAIISDASVPATLLSPYSCRNAININISGLGNTTFGTISNVIIQSNTIDARDAKFRAGVAADNISGLMVGGNNPIDGNNFLANINHDITIRSYTGDITFKNNIFKGGGVEAAVSKGNGAMIVSNNIFDGTYAHTIKTAMVRLFTNSYPLMTINFSYNQFINQKWSISFENTRNVILDHNDITAMYDNFRLISINTKLRLSSGPATLEPIDIKLTNNNLNAMEGLITGNALEFLNFDQRPANNYIPGNYVIGEPGNENNFNANIPTLIKVSNLDGYSTLLQPFLDLYPEYADNQYASTTGYWKRDIFARHNRFFVNGSLKLASAFSAEDFNAVYTSIIDRQDDINVGAVVLMPTWSGAVSTDWSDANNWSYQFIPAAGLDAVIYPQVNQPILSADAVCDTLILSSGMKLQTGTHNLTVIGNVRSNGTMDATVGSIILGGTVTQILSGAILVKNLTLSNPAGARIGEGNNNKVIIRGIYTSTEGVLVTNDNLVLKSDTAGTAMVANGSSNGGYITGQVTVERYIPLHKSWHLLSVPTNSTATIKQSWQEGAPDLNSNPVTGYGTQITSNKPTWLSDGFDSYSPGGPSVKTYNTVTNAWIGIDNTNTDDIKSMGGYMIFIRGDRTASSFSSPTTSTTLRTMGELFTGDLQPITVDAGKFAVIGNPYAAALDMRYISKTGLKDFFYLWDPKLGGDYGLGAYQTFSFNGSDYVITPGRGSYTDSGSVSNFIQSGQAFFVQATFGGGDIRITENAKINSPAQISTPGGTTLPQLRTNLYGIKADGSSYMIDGVISNYGNSYSNGVDDMDGMKLSNSVENLSIKTANSLLVVERRHTISTRDTVFLNLANTKAQQYRFEFKTEQLDQQGLTGFVEDCYLHTSTALDLTGTTFIDFNIVNIPASYAPDRFRIVFKQLTPLPVTFTSIKAYRHGSNINIEWKVENEINIRQYEVQKSEDGIQFTNLVVTPAHSSSPSTGYAETDTHPVTGYNYYRIKSVDLDGRTAYTNIVKLLVGKGAPGVTIYPNPVVDGKTSIQFNNLPAGDYTVRILSPLGQEIFIKTIQHPGGSSTELITLDKNIPHAIYQLGVTGPGEKINLSMIY